MKTILGMCGLVCYGQGCSFIKSNLPVAIVLMAVGSIVTLIAINIPDNA